MERVLPDVGLGLARMIPSCWWAVPEKSCSMSVSYHMSMLEIRGRFLGVLMICSVWFNCP